MDLHTHWAKQQELQIAHLTQEVAAEMPASSSALARLLPLRARSLLLTDSSAACGAALSRETSRGAGSPHLGDFRKRQLCSGFM